MFVDGLANGQFDETLRNYEFDPGEPVAVTDADGHYLLPVTPPLPELSEVVEHFGPFAEAWHRTTLEQWPHASPLLDGHFVIDGDTEYWQDHVSMSSDGRLVVFSSSVALLPSDTNGLRDIYLYDTVARQLTRVTQGNAFSDRAIVSRDGSTVVFESYASNLDPLGRDGDSRQDIYAYDVATASIRLISIDASGTGTANADVHEPSVSSDGSVIAFWSFATNLDPLGRVTGGGNVYAFDLSRDTMTLVSVSHDRSEDGNNGSSDPVVSSDGQVIAFDSYANNLDPLDFGTTGTDVFAYNLTTDTMTLVSVGASGAVSGNGSSRDPMLNRDGTVIAFQSSSTNLDPAGLDSDASTDVYVYNTTTGTMTLVSRGADGLSSGNDTSRNASIDLDGNIIAFESWASNLDPSGLDTDNEVDVYVYDIATATLKLVSRSADGTRNGDGASMVPMVGDNGEFVVFPSAASNLDGSGLDNDFVSSVYRFDLATETNVLISSNSSATETGNGASDKPAISADGSIVAFRSESTNLLDVSLASRTSLTWKGIYVKDVATSETQVASLSDHLNLALAEIVTESRSSSGRYVAFATHAPLVDGDTNLIEDVYVRDRVRGTVTLVSHTEAGAGGDAASFDPVISADGSTIAFQSFAADIDPTGSDASNDPDVYRYDVLTGALKLVSLIDDPIQDEGGPEGSETLAVNADGRVIVYTSRNRNVFAYDSSSETLKLLTPGGGYRPSFTPVVSDNGNVVAFQSYRQLSLNDLPDGYYVNGFGQTYSDVYTYDLGSDEITILSRSADGRTSGDRASSSPSISTDGTVVAFSSGAKNIDPAGIDTDSTNDIYLYDSALDTLQLVSVSYDGTSGSNGGSYDPVFGMDDNIIEFESYATNLDPQDVDSNRDTYRYDRTTGELTVLQDVPITNEPDDRYDIGNLRVVLAGQSTVASEGQTLVLQGTVTDPFAMDGSDWSGRWMVVNERGFTVLDQAIGSLGFTDNAFALPEATTPAQPFMPLDAGRYRVTLQVTDNDTNAIYTDSYNLAVTGVAPTAETGGPYQLAEGAELFLDGTGSEDSAAGDTLTYAWTINGQPFPGSDRIQPIVSWANLQVILQNLADGPKTGTVEVEIALTVTDPDDGGVDGTTTTLQIANAGPEISLGGPFVLVAGGDLTVHATVTDPAFDGDLPLSYRWLVHGNEVSNVPGSNGSDLFLDWSQLTDLGVGYLVGGDNTFTVTLEATDGESGVASASDDLTILNQTPTADAGGDASNNYSLVAGDELLLDGTGSSDPDSHPIEVYWNVVAPTLFDLDVAALEQFTLPSTPESDHYDLVGTNAGMTWEEILAAFEGTPPDQIDLQMFVRDTFGEASMQRATVTISNGAPSALLSHSATGYEGTPTAFWFTQVEDPTPADLLSLSYELWIDLNGDGDFDDPDESIPATAQDPVRFEFAFPDDGTYAVQGRVADSAGASATIRSEIEVLNRAPTGDIALTVSGAIMEGRIFGVGFINQQDAADDLSAGLVSVFDIDGDGLFGDVADTIQFADNGAYVIRGRLIDKDGGTYEDSFVVVVENIAPTIDTLISSPAVTEGELLTITGTFTDPGIDDPWVATVRLASAEDPAGFTLPVEIDTQQRSFRADYLVTREVPGGYDVTLLLSDGVDTVASDPQKVLVANDIPEVDAGTKVESFNEFRRFSRVASFQDAGSDYWAIAVAYGDGSEPQAPSFVSEHVDSVTTFGLEHVYTSPGTYVVVVTVDDGTDVGTDEFTITIADNNAPTVAEEIDDLQIRQGVTLRTGYGNLHETFIDVDNPNAELTFSVESIGDPTVVTAAEISEDGALDLVFASDQIGVSTLRIRATDPAGDFAEDEFAVRILRTGNAAEVIGRHVFYNNSSFDTVSNDAAVASDKEALLPGEIVGKLNYTSYSRGINGIMVDVFYFGNAVAEAGNSASDATVTTTDLLLARNNPRNPVSASADVTFPYDFDRDGHVNATDVLLARNNQTSFFNALKLIDLSGESEAASELPVAELAWLTDLNQPATQRPAKDATAGAVDRLLATYWPE